MRIKKNKNGTYTLEEVSLGKLQAMVRGIDDLEELHERHHISILLDDVRGAIKNNPDYIKDTKQA